MAVRENKLRYEYHVCFINNGHANCEATTDSRDFLSLILMQQIVTHLLQDIYNHPEYLPALREEVKDVLDDPRPDMSKLPLLESFLVESMRTHCFLATVIHRVPLKEYTFFDGYTVPTGEIVEFYQHNVFRDDTIYPNAQKFDPSRFKGTGRASTDMGMEWPFWGNSKLAW
jgi:cytochrome P450